MTSFQINASFHLHYLPGVSQSPQGGFLFTEEGTEAETELRGSLMGCSDPGPGEAGRERQDGWTLLPRNQDSRSLLLESSQYSSLLFVTNVFPGWDSYSA